MRIQIAIIALFLGIALSTSLKAGTDITISGLSSGAFMAVQMHVANSATIRGAGVFAGGPYYCAKGSMMTAMTSCMSTGFGIDTPGIKNQIKSYEKAGKIDASSNLSGHKVFIFSGKSDSTVCNKVAQAGEQLYKDLGADVKVKYDFPAAHTMPTVNYGNICTLAMKPFIGKCSYNGAFEALNSLFDGKLTQGSGKYIKSNLYSVSQKTSGTTIFAYVYAPTACKEKDANCPLHVVFHGCQQTINDIQMQYVENTGYNEVAEDNNLIILYPQVVSSMLTNPNGCWDWWGYTNADYATKNGPQIKAVNDLISGLTSGSIELTPFEEDSNDLVADLLVSS